MKPLFINSELSLVLTSESLYGARTSERTSSEVSLANSVGCWLDLVVKLMLRVKATVASKQSIGVQIYFDF